MTFAVQPSLFEEVEPIVFDGRSTKCCVCGRTLTDPFSVAAGVGPVCGGKGHRSNEKTTPTLKELTVSAKHDSVLSFTSPVHGSASACRMRLYDTPSGPLVLLTEVADNPGASITNTAESAIKNPTCFIPASGAMTLEGFSYFAFSHRPAYQL